MKKHVIILAVGLLLSLISLVVNAKPVDREEASKAAKAFLKIEQLREEKKAEKLAKEGRQILKSIEKHKMDNTTPIYGQDNQIVAWVIELQPEGYIVTSAEDRIKPIIAYSFTGSFPFEELKQNVFLHLVQGDMQGRLRAIESKSQEYLSAAECYTQEWQEYSSGDITIIPLSDPLQWPSGDNNGWLDTNWDQGGFYKQYCPFDPVNNPTPTTGLLTGTVRCTAGCTATAMAQIVNYWQFPTSIVLSNSDNYVSSYTPNGEQERRIYIDVIPDGANDGGQVYSYEYDPSMTSINYNENGAQPSNQTISKLIYACGVLIKQNYSDNWTEGFNYRVQNVLINRYSYASAELKNTETDSDFYEILQQNMKDGYPAQLGIRKSSVSNSGHAIVCDGYRSTGHYHLNFGWGLSGPANPAPITETWYSLPAGMPASYNIIDGGVLNIYPQEGVPAACSPFSGDDEYEGLMYNEKWFIPNSEIGYELTDYFGQWLSDIDGCGVSADWDWYQAHVSSDELLVTIHCRFFDSQGDIDLHLFDEDGVQVADSTSSTDNELIEVILPDSGWYFLRVGYDTGFNGQTYNLKWNATSPPPVIVSGYVRNSVGDGIEGVALAGWPGADPISHSDGYYEGAIPYNWSGTITPEKSGYEFIPKVYQKVKTDLTNQNYTGTLVTRIIRLEGDLAFGNVAVGQNAQRIMTVYNDGNRALSVNSIICPAGFSASLQSFTVVAGGSQPVTITFSPTAVQSHSGTITVNSDKTSGTNTIPCSGIGVSRIIRLEGDLSFGNVMVGQNVHRILNVYNDGNSPLSVSSISCPSGFNANPQNFTVDASGNQPITITFSPTAVQSYSGTITVNSDKSSGTDTLSCSGTGTHYGGGSGTQADPYKISNVLEFLALSSTSVDWDKHFILTADIDLTSQIFTQTPITQFTGILEGNGHKISNLTIMATSNDYVGLFGYIGSGGRIRNLGIENANVTGWYSVGGLAGNNDGVITSCYVTGSIGGYYTVGGLAGDNRGTITSCYATGIVNGDQAVGGLVGSNYSGMITPCMIISCYATGTVNGSYADVGGLVGWNDGAITFCYAAGSVNGFANYIGGLVGWNGDTITSCFWDVQTSGQATSAGGVAKTTAEMEDINTYLNAGWDFSDSDGDPADWWMPNADYPHLEWESYCTFYTLSLTKTGNGSVKVNGTLQSLPWSGLFAVGTNITLEAVPDTSWQFLSWSGTLSGSKNPAFTLINGVKYVMATFVPYSGGSGTVEDPYKISNIADFQLLSNTPSDWNKSFILTDDIDLSGQIFTCAPVAPDTDNAEWNYFQGTAFTGIFDGDGHKICNLTITATSNDYVGLFGYVGSYGQIRNLGVENVNVSGRFYTGGLAGSNGNDSTITSCYVTGNVSGYGNVGGLVGEINFGTILLCYATGSVSGYAYVGGLVGWSYASVLTDCYATSLTSATSSYVGGLVGNNIGSLTACFWDIDTSGKTVGVGAGSSTGVAGKTTAEMQTFTTFTDAGWDFTDTDGDPIDWMMPYADYPHLAWEPIWTTNPDINLDYKVNLVDFSIFVENWKQADCISPSWCGNADIDRDGNVDLPDLVILASHWLEGTIVEPSGMAWVSINDPGVSGHEGFDGQMSKYEITNAQYCQFLNAANASGDITFSGDYVVGATGPYAGQNYYNLAGSGYTNNGATNGGAARINWTSSTFTVDSGFENHPVTYVSWYGSMAFASYYGWRLPTEWEWQAVADYTDNRTYATGTSINNLQANYYGSTHPHGTTPVGQFGTYGYGIADMAGNVSEWVIDAVMVRGGGWSNYNTNCMVWDRTSFPPLWGTSSSIGFRVCR